MSSTIEHPGVYVNEVDAFPNAAAQVATAAFGQSLEQQQAASG